MTDVAVMYFENSPKAVPLLSQLLIVLFDFNSWIRLLLQVQQVLQDYKLDHKSNFHLCEWSCSLFNS